MNGKAKILVSLLSVFLLFPFIGNAQEAIITTGTVNVDIDASEGGNNSGDHYWEINAGSLYQVNAIAVNFCGLGATGGGIDLIFREGTTTGAILASTSIESADLPPCGRQIGAYYEASTTNAFLYNYFTTSQPVFVTLRYRNVGGIIYGQYKYTTATDGDYYFHTTPGTRYKVGSNYYVPVFTLYSTAEWLNTYESIINTNIGSSTRMIECDAWYDLDCQISNAITFLFIPRDEAIDPWKELNLASTTPFGYVYDIPGLFQNIFSTTSATFQLNINFATLGQHADVFRNIATSSVTVFDACWLNRGVGEAGTNMYQTYVIPFIKAALWLGFIFGIWALAHRLL